MSHFCHYVITGQLKAASDCYTRNIALKLNGNNPDVCLSCSGYIGKRKAPEPISDLERLEIEYQDSYEDPLYPWGDL